MAYSERELIARMIQCEAGGEGDNGMKAVASVIMNRVNVATGEYARVSQDPITRPTRTRAPFWPASRKQATKFLVGMRNYCAFRIPPVIPSARSSPACHSRWSA